MALSKEVIDDIHHRLAARIRELGFRKRRGEIFTKQLPEGFLGWLGLNRGVDREEGVLAINPVVGVRQQAVEDLVAKLLENKPHPYIPATISVSLGYLMPQQSYQVYLFGKNQSDGANIDSLVESFRLYGIPFIDRMASFEEIREVLLSYEFTPTSEHRFMRRTAALALAGDNDKAVDELREQLRALEGRDDMAAQLLRSYSGALESLIAFG